MTLLRITGRSMHPTLREGDIALALPLRPREGTVVALHHPRLGRMVKRLGPDGTLHSDSPNGTASERLGTLSEARYLGRVVLAVTPRGVRRVRRRPAPRPCSRPGGA